MTTDRARTRGWTPARRRLAVLAGALGGLGWALLGAFAASIDIGTAPPYYRLLDALSVPALALMLAGLVGFRDAGRGASGRVGAAGSLLTALGLTAALVGSILSTATPLPVGWELFSAGYLAALIGAGIYGAARLRAGIEPRLGAVLLVAALPAGLAVSFLVVLAVPTAGEEFLAAGPAVLLGAAWTVLGLRARGASARST